MKFQIHFTKNDVEGSYVLEGESLIEVRVKNKDEMERRGLDYLANKCWSQEIF